MIQSQVPSYRFTFPRGLSSAGVLERECFAIDGGSPHRFSYVLDDGSLAHPFSKVMSSELSDLIDVCGAIYLADRLSPRAFKNDARPVNERWRRELEVIIPVRCVDRWNAPDVHALVEDLACYVSDDSWTFRFVPRCAEARSAAIQRPLFSGRSRPTSEVILHSGGLDSLFGIIEAATSGFSSNVLAVSVVTNRRLSRVVGRVLQELRPMVPGDIEGFRLRTWISEVDRKRDNRESSQRTRALLYLAAGVAVADLSGSGLLYLSENGPGALNLACTPDQAGARATRAVHPKTLALFAELATRVLERPITVINSGLFHTKGELAKILSRGDFAPAVQETVSCDRFPYFPVDKACGTCSSCLYRRVALHAVGLDHLDAERYQGRNLLDDPGRSPELDLIPLHAQRILVERLRSLLASPQPFADLRREFLAIDDAISVAPSMGLPEKVLERSIVRLMHAHVHDSDAFFARIDLPGWGPSAVPTELTARSAPFAIAG